MKFTKKDPSPLPSPVAALDVKLGDRPWLTMVQTRDGWIVRMLRKDGSDIVIEDIYAPNTKKITLANFMRAVYEKLAA